MTDGERIQQAPPPPLPPHPVLAEVVRSGFVEGWHRGSLVVLGADGETELALGDVTSPVLPRSSNKPMQVTAVLRAGAELDGAELDGRLVALAAGSHAGEAFHARGVREILALAGVPESALRVTPGLPLDQREAEDHLRAGGRPEPLLMNCSGKHAAMLAACAANGWPLESYLDPGHPLQQLIVRELSRAGGEPVRHIGVDGCGAPLAALSLTGLARAFARLITSAPGTPERRVADAMRAHPEYVGGTNRPDTWLMRELPGAIAKAGAEAVQAVALPDGRALAFKLDDGAGRATGPVLARALRWLGMDAPVLDRIANSPVLGGGTPVGGIRPAF